MNPISISPMQTPEATSCEAIRERFSLYLDGAVSGAEMQIISSHLSACAGCDQEFAAWRSMQQTLVDLRRAQPPADLGLRLRLAISRQHRNPMRHLFDRLDLAMRNTIAPHALRLSAGLASAAMVVGTFAVLVGLFAAPDKLVASDEPIGSRTQAHFLYSQFSDSVISSGSASAVIVDATIAPDGRAYDFRILSGQNDAATHNRVANWLLFSVFEPARVFGQPVAGHVVLSFAGVSVRG